MNASEWAVSQLENLSDRETIVWIEDPYRLLTDDVTSGLERRLARSGHRWTTERIFSRAA